MSDEGGDAELKDVTLTSFGLVIAYLLPGLAGLYGLSFWSAAVKKIFGTFLTSQSSVGLFLIVVLASLMVGLFANGVRWLIFEVCFLRRHRLDSALMSNLSGERKLGAYRSAIDEMYRYHQWYGGTAVMAPIGYVGWFLYGSTGLSALHRGSVVAAFVAIEVLCVIAAGDVWIRTIRRIHYVLGKEIEMNEAPALKGTPGGPGRPLPPSPRPNGKRP